MEMSVDYPMSSVSEEPRLAHDLPNRRIESWQTAVWGVAVMFFSVTTTVSWLRWANFEYRTFDLAYYVQAIWQLIHGRFEVSVEHVPLLGNHVEPIVFLFAPVFALVRHPMTFVVIQNAGLALMAPIGFRLARLYFEVKTAALLAIALLLAPAAGYVALHEFHPEALTAPLLLLMIYAAKIRRHWLHWLCFIGILACKENMALLLSAYCVVFLILEWRKAQRAAAKYLVRWYVAPLAVAVGWLILCLVVITPALNSGNIDYGALYDRLGKNAPDIVWNLFTKPWLAGTALAESLTRGNLVWGLLLPFLALPFLRPRWLLIGAPILLQHLLSWRSSEWNIYFHYAAPLLPLCWVAMVEALDWVKQRGLSSPFRIQLLSYGAILACLVAQFWIGPAIAIESELLTQASLRSDRQRKEEFLQKIPSNASVVAPLPYLSHLAMREKLYSLHYILKGLKTLSRQRYEPPPSADFVFIDYDDTATFDAGAGYYHPQWRGRDGTVVPSSDRLLHEFLRREQWNIESENALTLFRRDVRTASEIPGAPARAPVFTIGNHTTLVSLRPRARTSFINQPAELELEWSFGEDRPVIPWMHLRLTGKGQRVSINKGLCSPQAGSGIVSEQWRFILPAGFIPDEYMVEALFSDNSGHGWSAPPVLLGTIRFVVPQDRRGD